MKLQISEQVDAAYVELSDAFVDRTERLGPDRMIDYAADGTILGYEFLNVRRHGVDLSDLPHRDELARIFVDHNVRVLV
jgi:uncharacterized protein YuzE